MSLRKVLIVDDEERIRKGLETIIEWNEYGYEICGTAGNGRNGIVLAKLLKPDLIILDIRMPGIDGLQMIEALREDAKQTRYIILSGYKDFEYAQKCIDLKVAAYLLKPVNKDELIKKITEIIPDDEYSLNESEPDDEPSLDPNDIVERIIDYIDQNYSQALKLNLIAKTFHYSTAYLGRIFKRITGYSFHSYLDKVRMEKAKELLKKGNKVYVVAKMTGYNNVDYFVEKFKLYIGKTPTEYKNEC